MAAQRTFKWSEEKKNFIRERINEDKAIVKKEFATRFGPIRVEAFYAMFSELRPSTGRRLHEYTDRQVRWLTGNPSLSGIKLEEKFRQAFPTTNLTSGALLTQRRRLLDPNRNKEVQWNDEKDLYLLETMRDKVPATKVARHLEVTTDHISNRRLLLKLEYGQDIAGAIRSKQIALNGATAPLIQANINGELQKTQTGIAAELLVAGELSRRGFNVAITFGNTKAIDLLVDKDGRMVAVQVKGIQKTASICWNVSLEKIRQYQRDQTYDKIMYVLVNIHADTLEATEYFILTTGEMLKNVKPVNSGRDYIDYNSVKRLRVQDQWQKI